MLKRFEDSELRTRVRELAESDNFKDLFIYSSLPDVWNFNGDENIENGVREYVSKSLELFQGQHRYTSSKVKNWNLTPYAKRHPILESFLFSTRINTGEYVFKKIPLWFSEKFPRNANTLTKIVWSIIDYDVFDTGIFPKKVWDEARKKFPSPMDRACLSKPKLGAIIKHLVEGGIASKALEDKYNSRIKTKDSFELINCSASPIDFLRVSCSSNWSSCVGPGGTLNDTIWAYMTLPTKAVIYIDDEKLYESNRIKAAKARCIIHIAGEYELYNNEKLDGVLTSNKMQSLFELMCRYVSLKDKSIFKYSIKLKNWYIIPDRVYCGNESMLAPIIHILYNRCQEIGIKMALPSNYNSSQDGATKANFNFSTDKNLIVPIVTSMGWRNYSDNFGNSYFDSKNYINKQNNSMIDILPMGVVSSDEWNLGTMYSQYIKAYEINKIDEVDEKLGA